MNGRKSSVQSVLPHKETPSSPSGPNVEVRPTLDVAEDDDIEEGELEPQDYNVASSASASVRSSILEHEYEYGRRYRHYRQGTYPLPNGDVEQGRDNRKHVLHLEADNGRMFNAPIGKDPQRILDLGTGTGLRVTDVADQYPSAEVVGLDLSPIQPTWVPPNVRFLVDDIEDDWVESNAFDLVHMRHVATFVKDMDKLLRNCHEHLTPGGWLEVDNFCGYASCDDGTMPGDYPVNECFTLLREAQDALSGLITTMGSKLLRSLEMGDAEMEMVLAAARKSLKDTGIHSYSNYVSWWGQRPVDID